MWRILRKRPPGGDLFSSSRSAIVSGCPPDCEAQDRERSNAVDEERRRWLPTIDAGGHDFHFGHSAKARWLRRREASNPSPQKPRIIIAHVEGSGTAGATLLVP